MSIAQQPAVYVRQEFAIRSGDDAVIASLDVQRRHGALLIQSVFVHEEHRGKGLMPRLLEAVIVLQGDEPLYLYAEAYADQPLDDAGLMAYYARFGFEPIPAFPGGMVRRPHQGAYPDLEPSLSEQP